MAYLAYIVAVIAWVGGGGANAHIRSMTVPALAEWLVSLARLSELCAEANP